MIKLFAILVSFSLMFMSSLLHAQGFSYDGNRWYEIEVSIFTNQNIPTNNPELFMPEDFNLSYPTQIRELQPLASFFSIDFDKSTAQVSEPFAPANEEAEEVFIGPIYREPNRDFRMVDQDRAAFVALPVSEHEFTRHNRNIAQSPEHRMLYHAVWRQPALNKVQSTAVFIRGGDRFGDHNELEGSLTISYNVNRVDVDARLWRNSFSVSSELQWDVPDQPFPASTQAENFGLFIERVYPMQQIRQMISNELHYLDHPAFGMLIEVRPYELPNIFEFSLD